MGISENVYIDRKALEYIGRIADSILVGVEEEDYLRVKAGEIIGVIRFAEMLKEGDKKDDNI